MSPFRRDMPGYLPDLSQYGAVPTNMIGAYSGALPGAGMNDVSLLEMVGHGVREGFAAPFMGLAETVGLVESGTRQRWRDEFEEARLSYLSGDPHAFRAIVAGASEALPMFIPYTGMGKAASAVAKVYGKTPAAVRAIRHGFGAIEGAALGLGETAGQPWEQRLLGAGIGGALGGAVGVAISDEAASKATKLLDVQDDFEQKLINLRNKWIRSSGDVPEDIFLRTEAAVGAIASRNTKATRIISSLERAVKDELKADPRLVEDDLWLEIDRGLRGEAVSRASFQTGIDAFRRARQEYVDEMSHLGMIDLDNPQTRFEQAVAANQNTYIHRSAKAFDDPEFRRTWQNEDGTWNEAFGERVDSLYEAIVRERDSRYRARVEAAEAGQPVRLPPEITREEVEGAVVEMLNAAAQEQKVFLGAIKNLGPADLRAHMKRGAGDTHAEVMKILGEYHDPRVNIRKTLHFQAMDLEMNKLYEDLAENFFTVGDNPLAKRLPTAQGEYQYTFPSSRGYGAVKGPSKGRSWNRKSQKGYLFFNEEGKKVLDALLEAKDQGTFGFFDTLSGATKYLKTILAPVTHLRNLGSGNYMLSARGHMPMMFDKKAWKVAMGWGDPDALIRHVDGELDELDRYVAAHEDLMRHHIVQNSTFAGDLKRYKAQSKIKLGESKGGGPLGQALKWIDENATALYQGTDDMWKTQFYVKEQKRWAKHLGLDVDDDVVKALSRSAVNDMMQIYSRVNRAVSKIRDIPLTGPFISFPAEITRNAKNMVRRMMAEAQPEKYIDYWRTNVPELFDAAGDWKFKGEQREALFAGMNAVHRKALAGFATTLFVPIAAAASSRAIFGLTRDQVRAMQESAVAPWSQASSLMIIGNDEKEDKVSFIDLSFANPYAYLQKPLRFLTDAAEVSFKAMAQGGAVDDSGWEAVMQALEEAASPATQPEIWLSELTRGISALGKMRSLPLKEQAKEAMYRFYRAAAPGAALSFERFVRGLDMPGVRDYLPATSKYGQRFSPLDEALSIATGMRITRVDLKRAMQYKGSEYFSARGQARRLYNYEAKNRADRSTARIQSSMRSAIEANELAGAEILRHIQNMRKVGLTNGQIVRALNAGGVSKSMALKLVYYGQVPKLNFQM